MPGASMQASMIFPVWGGEGRRVGRGSICIHTGIDDSSLLQYVPLPQYVSLPQVASLVGGGTGRQSDYSAPPLPILPPAPPTMGCPLPSSLVTAFSYSPMLST